MNFDIEKEITLLKQEIAINHGVIFSEDDPIMTFVTINHRLICMMESAHERLLEQYKADILLSSKQQQIKFEQQAEFVLNAALDASNKLIKQAIETHIQPISNLLFNSPENPFTTHRKKDNKFIHGLVTGVIAGFFVNTMILLFF